MRVALTMLALVLVSGCAMSHSLEGDASVMTASDAQASADAAVAIDAGPPVVDPGAPTGVVCGPNRCLLDEVCCNAECGVCAFDGECVDHGCLDP